MVQQGDGRAREQRLANDERLRPPSHFAEIRLRLENDGMLKE